MKHASEHRPAPAAISERLSELNSSHREKRTQRRIALVIRRVDLCTVLKEVAHVLEVALASSVYELVSGLHERSPMMRKLRSHSENCFVCSGLA